MGSAFAATVAALMALAFVEGFAAQYPSRATWYRLRRTRGRFATRRMRERFELAAKSRAPRILALVLLAAIAAWAVIGTKWIDKDWDALVFDSLSSVVVAIALLRTPRALSMVAERMKDHERGAGEDPDADLDDGAGDGGPAAVAL